MTGLRNAMFLLLMVAIVPLPADDLLTGRKLAEALDTPLSAAWTGISRRSALNRLVVEKRLGLLLDRRIDPSVEILVDAADKPLGDVLQDLLPDKGGYRVVGDAVYLGPEPAIRRLRTTIALRTADLRKAEISTSRQLDLARVLTVHWGDLSTPREILQQFESLWDVQVVGADRLPHDLWAAATLTNQSLAEALSLVLAQFDQTFNWLPDGSGVTIVPLPELVVIEQRHRIPPGADAERLIDTWQASYPGLTARMDGPAIVVAATIEQHEALSSASRPGERRPPRKPAERQTPLSRVRVTLRWENPARKLLETLTNAADTQLTFEFDEAALKTAGIDLDTRIRFSVEKATVSELLHAAFDPLKIRFILDDRTVTLSPQVPSQIDPESRRND